MLGPSKNRNPKAKNSISTTASACSSTRNTSAVKTGDSRACYELLILDDLGMGKLREAQRHDLLEVLEDRYDERSTIVTSQLPFDKWHDWVGDPTIADAILDRLVHNAYKVELKGESQRKNKAKTNSNN